MTEPVTSQPVGTVSPVTMSSEGSWSTGRYDCFADLPMCTVGFLCPIILASCVTYKYGEHWCLGIVPGGMTALRTHMRLSYGIPGTLCQDALAMFCCGWCELCRMAREVYTRTRSS
ncbi:cornifelin homolog A-like [Eublepharis macularius]|uniref:Cornifelin homolog A-like n=1 Tax=Eublepharis macularius TaxID=481883 RepID=A0AA97KIR1_EUBMA|nr:cornifelin homolog A-like [Eublepharis macularius]